MINPFFSIIIPTLNEEDYLPRLLNDLVKQKEKQFEVIVVDGGSEDSTLLKTKEFLDSLPLVILSSSKKNVSLQRNLGAQKSHGRYLVFFDADVQIPVQFLEQLKLKLGDHKAPFATTYLKADSRQVNDRMIATLYNLGAEASLLIERPFVAGFNFIVKREIFLGVGGFREDIKHGEDYELATRLFQLGVPLKILKNPKLTFSLRRYRTEGKLTVFRKHALATLHVFTRGNITRDLFDYPMGGGWYKTYRKTTPNGLEQAQLYVKRFLKLLTE